MLSLLLSVGTMEVITIKEITSNKENQSVNFKATVKSRSNVLSWENNRNSGTRITGVLCDQTSSIDFVCFTKAVEKFDKVLRENSSYAFKHVKVGMANRGYSKSSHPCQILLNDNSTIEEEDIPPLVAPFSRTQIKDLSNVEKDARVTVVGKVIEIPTPEPFFWIRNSQSNHPR